jgi:hypothetical protein
MAQPLNYFPAEQGSADTARETDSEQVKFRLRPHSGCIRERCIQDNLSGSQPTANTKLKSDKGQRTTSKQTSRKHYKEDVVTVEGGISTFTAAVQPS